MQVSDEKLPLMDAVPESEMLRALCVLRLATAYIAVGDLQPAQDALNKVGDLLEAQAEVDEAAIPGFLVPEYQFYCTLMNLIIARTAQDIKSLENHMLAVRFLALSASRRTAGCCGILDNPSSMQHLARVENAGKSCRDGTVVSF